MLQFRRRFPIYLSHYEQEKLLNFKGEFSEIFILMTLHLLTTDQGLFQGARFLGFGEVYVFFSDSTHTSFDRLFVK